MCKLEEQETTISIIEYTGEIDMYSCTPRIVERMMNVAAKNRLSIKVMDVEGSKPKAVQMTRLQSSEYHHASSLVGTVQSCANKKYSISPTHGGLGLAVLWSSGCTIYTTVLKLFCAQIMGR